MTDEYSFVITRITSKSTLNVDICIKDAICSTIYAVGWVEAQDLKNGQHSS